jgi:hypothetical protein
MQGLLLSDASQTRISAHTPSDRVSARKERTIVMSKVIAIMSMSLDGYIADRNDGVAEVFDWYFSSGDVAFHTGGSDPIRRPRWPVLRYTRFQ